MDSFYTILKFSIKITDNNVSFDGNVYVKTCVFRLTVNAAVA